MPLFVINDIIGDDDMMMGRYYIGIYKKPIFDLVDFLDQSILNKPKAHRVPMARYALIIGIGNAQVLIQGLSYLF